MYVKWKNYNGYKSTCCPWMRLLAIPLLCRRKTGIFFVNLLIFGVESESPLFAKPFPKSWYRHLVEAGVGGAEAVLDQELLQVQLKTKWSEVNRAFYFVRT
jgi:hypothetical protein